MKKNSGYKFIFSLIIVVLLLTRVPATAGLISTEQEIKLGREAARQLESKYGLYNDPHMNVWVVEVGRKLAYVSPREGITYSFKIIKMKEPNAFAIPGGFIYVTTGLMQDFVKNDEDYLAVILGHELGHVNERHGMSQLEWQMGLGLVLQILLGDNNTISDIAQVASGLIFLKYSRDQELEADQWGMRLAYKTGHNPRALIRFFKDIKKYEEQHPSATPEFLESHPDTDSRIEEANKYIAELEGKPWVEDSNSKDNKNPDEYYNNPDITKGETFSGDLSGIWEATIAGPLELQQRGKKVTGTYQKGKGFLEGTIEGNRMNFKWRDNLTGNNGTGYFDISSDRNSLNGRWYSSAGESGPWQAWRKGENSSPSVPTQRPDETTLNISGIWQSVLGEISFVQTEASVEGTYGNGKGKINGIIYKNRFDCEWYEKVDNEKGTGYFIISSDGNSMTGQWFSETGATGIWSAYR
ncbi:MAG TPA: M48 family metallopeptidase [Candidatus Eremiobacteraeota bacterium]|nr:MAG: TPR repeat-containing protein YfgC precursor [bacterium ADurb.Bin363]HPZ07921.1 M48 family metallopeptidase [Candidatus Eremiobacteraeota bacterium]